MAGIGPTPAAPFRPCWPDGSRHAGGGDAAKIALATRSGVHAYVVDGNGMNRLRALRSRPRCRPATRRSAADSIPRSSPGRPSSRSSGDPDSAAAQDSLAAAMRTLPASFEALADHLERGEPALIG
jgi:hypothetical protein